MSGTGKRSNSQTTSVQQANNELQLLRTKYAQIQQEKNDLVQKMTDQEKKYTKLQAENELLKNKINQLTFNAQNADNIVQAKTQEALRDKLTEIKDYKLKADNMESNNIILEQQVRNLQEKIAQQESRYQDLIEATRANTARGGLGEIESFEKYRKLMDEANKKRDEAQRQWQTAQNDMSRLRKENQMLKRMQNVPDNFDLEIQEAMNAEKDKIDDYEKLILVIQKDNQELEKERAKLKNEIRQLTLMVKTDQPRDRYSKQQLSDDQLFALDNYMTRLVSGAEDTSEISKLKRENEDQKNVIETFVKGRGWDLMLSKMGGKLGGGGIDANQMDQILQSNAQLRDDINLLLRNYIANKPTGVQQTNVGGNPYYDANSPYQPPELNQPREGVFMNAKSRQFNQQYNLTDANGGAGVAQSTVWENAFLQAQLMECFDLIRRKDSTLKSQKEELELLNQRMRSQCMIQDQLYMDFVRMERHYQKREEEQSKKHRVTQDQLMEEQTKNQKLEQLHKALQTGGESNASRLLELTKQNSILDVNLLKLARKYQCLEEQEKLLRREYHSKDEDQAQKELEYTRRIWNLRGWKQRAITQLRAMQEKLRLAIPKTEYDIVAKEVELVKQQARDLQVQNSTLAHKFAEIQKKHRQDSEAVVRLEEREVAYNALLEEYGLIKQRLEVFDPVFRFENEVFTRMARVLSKARVSAEQAFAEFDKDKNGLFSRDEMKRIMAAMKIELSAREEKVVWDALDVDQSGSVDFQEFLRKLEYYGHKNVSRDEFIFTQVYLAMKDTSVGTPDRLFQLIDKKNCGTISREDFKDVFNSLQIKIEPGELERFMDNFWKTDKAAIDYQSFIRIFDRYKLKHQRESRIKEGVKVVDDSTIKAKKALFNTISAALTKHGRTLADLFAKIDVDRSANIEPEEFSRMLESMHIKYPLRTVKEIFDSMDVDGNGSLSLPEIQADFNYTIQNTEEQLLVQNRARRQDQKHAPNSISDAEYKKIQDQQSAGQMAVRNKVLQEKLSTVSRVMHTYEKNVKELMNENSNLMNEREEIKLQNEQLKTENIRYQKEAKNSIKRDLADSLQVKNEELKTQLNEMRAAMLTYKNMHNVIADQAKTLRLIMDRKKDENENLMNALREMQSEGSNQERIGKLYFIIMLSRWQEATVNKKYESVLSENKLLREELHNMHAENDKLDVSNWELDVANQKLTQDLSQVQHKVGSSINQREVERQMKEMSNRVMELFNNLADYEYNYMEKCQKLRQEKEKNDTLVAQKEYAENMLNRLQNNNTDEFYKYTAELSAEWSSMRFKELKAVREADEANQKVDALNKLLKSRNDHINTLEEKAASIEAKMKQDEQEFRRIDNKRMKDFFYLGANNLLSREQGYQGYQRRNQGGSTNLGRINDAAGMTTDNIKSLTKKDLDFNATVRSNIQLPTNNGDKDARIASLEQSLNDARSEIRRQKQINERQLGLGIQDDYLKDGDAHMAEQISKQRASTQKRTNEEQEQFNNAAVETIKIQQEMLDKKNDHIKQKEEQIDRMRSQAAQQREVDAKTISDLREQLAITGNNTLAKMQEIVTRHQGQGGKGGTMSSAQLSDLSEFRKQLAEKDDIIAKLTSQLKGGQAKFSKASDFGQQKDQKIMQLEQQKRDLEMKLNQDSSMSRKLQDTQKTVARLTDENKKLQKAFDGFKLKITEYEGKLGSHTESSQAASKKQEFQEATHRKELNDKQAQIDLAKRKMKEAVDRAERAAVDQQEAHTKVQSMKQEVEALIKKNKELQLESDKQKMEIKKLETQVNGYKDKEQIAGNLGGTKTNIELEGEVAKLKQEINKLSLSQKVVVCYNAEYGSFEYIGTPSKLAQYEATNLNELLQRLKDHFKSGLNQRLSVGTVFKSLDRNQVGKVKKNDVKEGFNRLGIELFNGEVSLLEEKLDVNRTNNWEYEPLLRELKGIPQSEFINDNMKRLATLITEREIKQTDFLRQMEGRSRATQLSCNEFIQKMLELEKPPTFEWRKNNDNEDIKQIFAYCTRTTTQNVHKMQIKLDTFVEETYQAVKAINIQKLREAIKNSRHSLEDQLHKFGKGKQSLSYNDFEDVMLAFGEVIYPTIRDMLIHDFLDPANYGQITFDRIRDLFGAQSTRSSGGLDAPRPKDQQLEKMLDKCNFDQDQLNQAREAARKILESGVNVQDLLAKKDPKGEFILQNLDVKQTIMDRKINGLEPSKLDWLIRYCDAYERGLIVIPAFVQKVSDLGQETPTEEAFRRFATQVINNGVFLKRELEKYKSGLDTGKPKIEKVMFSKSLKNMGLGMSDKEVDTLFTPETAVSDTMDITSFCQRVLDAKNKKAPNFPKSAQRPGDKVQHTGNESSSGCNANTWEIEKKFSRTVEALKEEILEKNKEIKNINSQFKSLQENEQKYIQQIATLTNQKLNEKAKTPAETRDQAQKEFNLEENMQLKDQIYHLQSINAELTKSIQVKLKIELAQLMYDKEKVEDKLKLAKSQLRQKQDEIDRLVAYRPTDDIGARETQEYTKQKQIEMLQDQLTAYEKESREMQEKMFKTEERCLDLKFEKENFDLQYARLQKRITDLENYKQNASALSAIIKNQYEEELEKIRDDTEKLRGDSLSRQPGDSVKLKTKKVRTAQELEGVVDQLKRVVEKQRVQINELEKENQSQKVILGKRSDEPAMRKEIERLERIVQGYENEQNRGSEQDKTIKKLIFANKTLREDLQQEIDRYTLLQEKYKEILIKYNVLTKENERNQKNLFMIGTGAHLKNHENFLDDEGEFAPTRQAKRVAFDGKGTEKRNNDGGFDELNHRDGF